jgi:Tol biopolymer transport system component
MLRALPHLGMPRWSADGRSVVVKGYDRDGHYGLFLIELSTGRVSPLKLVPRMDETELGPYRWAPDGSLLVMIGHTCQKIDVQTGESAVLWTIDGRPGRFSILARTGDIAYIHQVKGATTIEVRNSDGTTRELLRARPDENFDFVEWVPDGSALIFTRHTFARGSDKAPQWPSLWRLDVRTLMARPMGLSVDSLRDVTVSPDGTQIAFTTGSPTQELWILEHYLPASYTAPPRR